MPPGKQQERRLRSKRGAASAAAASEAQTGSGGSSASAAGAGGRSGRARIRAALVPDGICEAWIGRGCDGSTVPYLDDVTRHFEQMRWPFSVGEFEIWTCVIFRSNLHEATLHCLHGRWPFWPQEIDTRSCFVVPCFADFPDKMDKILHALADRSDDEDGVGSNGNEGAAAAATVEDNPQAAA